MDKVSFVMAIVDRARGEEFSSLFWQNGVFTVFSAPCLGTAGESLLSILGLERGEKTLLFAVTGRHLAARLLKSMIYTHGINVPGGGIALTVPVGSIGGASSVSWLMDGSDKRQSEAEYMEDKRDFPYDLIIAIAQRGASDTVMAAAREAGARGGTIVHAKGTGAEYAQKFFGVTLAAEKEMILIVARHEHKDAIMRAIMEKAGVRTDSHAVVFSLPVESVAGLASVMKDDE